MFMHMARLIKPYNAARSQELQKHAEMAFAAAGDAGSGRRIGSTTPCRNTC